MMIDRVFPHVVGAKGTLREKLFWQAQEQGLSAEQAAELHDGAGQSATPPDHQARACLDSGESHADQRSLTHGCDGTGGFDRPFSSACPFSVRNNLKTIQRNNLNID